MYLRTASIIGLCICSFIVAKKAECSAEDILKPQREVQIQLQKPFDIRVGQYALLESDKVKVEFDGVIRDYRCPIEVQCAWKGAVRAN